MHQQSVINKDFTVSLSSVQCLDFFDSVREKSIVLIPERLQVARSLVVVLKSAEDIDVEVGLKFGEENEDYSEIRLSFHFIVTNLTQLVHVDEETKQVSFDRSLLYVILPVSFSTARGYYSAKLEESPLADFPYPIVKTEDLVNTCRIMDGRSVQ